MSSRLTNVVLENELSLHTAFKSATADRYYVTKVHMAKSVHNARVSHTQYGIRDSDVAMRQLHDYYDADTRRGLKHGDTCGTLLGKPVFLDETLKARVLILESEPIPA